MSIFSIGGVILAGGNSRRMGSPKELLPWRGGTLLSELVEAVTAASLPCLVVSNHGEQLPEDVKRRSGVTIIPDAVSSAGPVSGLVTAFRMCQEEVLLVLSCDLPFMDREQIDRLIQYAKGVTEWDVIAVHEQGRLHPLVALYHRRTQSHWESSLERGELRLMQTLAGLRVVLTPEGLLDPWAAFNANTLLEYQAAVEEEQRRQRGRL